MVTGPPLLLDKSTLQSLNPSKMEALSRHFTVVIPPILLWEIMGDLYSKKRNASNEDSLNTDLVQEIANKIVTHSAVLHTDYRTLCIHNMLGNPVTSSSGYIPNVPAMIIKDTPDGGTAALIDQSVEMAMIFNWQAGIFSDKEKIFAAEYRKEKRDYDWKKYEKQIKELEFPVKPTTLTTLYDLVNKKYSSFQNQRMLIQWYCLKLQLTPVAQSEIFRRYDSNPTTFQRFAPYAFFCFLVDMFFLAGLANLLITTNEKSKTHIDVEYIYYLPFVRAFSSSDKFHAKLWKIFGVEENQSFLWGLELSSELNVLKNFWESGKEEERSQIRKYLPYPPQTDCPEIAKIFKKLEDSNVMMSRNSYEGNCANERTEEEKKALVDSIMKKYRFLKGDTDSLFLN
ncbi:MAG: hypothetical protein KIT34_19055 [Cyanobacteria bacterium TGS_CYA1]|nr:hypothetical protein [Cyanobacteria bacterium TGS_CYA1]